MHESIRPACQKDAVTLATIIRESFYGVAVQFSLTSVNCPTHPSNCAADWIERDLAQGKRYLLLEVDGQPTGCVAVSCTGRPVGEIERLAVLPHARCQGYGRKLLDRALETLRDLGMFRADLAIIADHASLQAWYEHQGFAVTVVRPLRIYLSV